MFWKNNNSNLGKDINLSFRAGALNDESGVRDSFSQESRPKLKFNFTISIKFREPIRVGGSASESFMDDELTFVLKQASRPNPTIVYQDVNYYNYRTKVATRVDYGSMQVTLYDDVENYGHDMFEAYLKSISPIANIRKEQVNDVFNADNINGPKNIQFNLQGTIAGDNDRVFAGTGSVGPLPNTPGAENGIIEHICIRHWFWSESQRRDVATSLIPQIQYIEYQFLNPKIINMTLDELDMTQSEASTVMFNFAYDSVFIDSPANDISFDRILDPDGETFTINDIRAKIVDIERLIRRIRRLDTIPDISVLETAGIFIPPISGTLPNINFPKPNIKLPPILDTF